VRKEKRGATGAFLKGKKEKREKASMAEGVPVERQKKKRILGNFLTNSTVYTGRSGGKRLLLYCSGKRRRL